MATEMLALIPKIPLYKSSRAIGKPRLLPLNLTLNVTYHCPSRCQTCNIWKKNAKEMNLSEWEKTFKNIGSKSIYWLIISGGEPFSRKNLSGLCKLANEHLKPQVINIPTNGYLTESIFEEVRKILKYCPQTQLVINFSLDGIGKKHDLIRNLPGSFEKLLESYRKLREIKNSKLTVGIHTVISKLNFKNIPEIYRYVTENLKPDSYITEIAEKRVELDNQDLEIFPELQEYQEAIDFLLEKMKEQKFRGFSKITRSLRMEYYELVKKILKEKKQVIPCYAGLASAQITAEGEVWPCCVLGESMGNLRTNGYDFKKIWFSSKARIIRKRIKNKECHCPLASASYTNMLMNSKKLAKISSKMIFFK